MKETIKHSQVKLDIVSKMGASNSAHVEGDARMAGISHIVYEAIGATLNDGDKSANSTYNVNIVPHSVQ